MSEGNPYDEVTREIGGITYTARKLPTTAGLRVGAAIAKLIGDEDIIALFLASDEKQKAKLSVNPKVIGAAVARMAQNFDEDVLAAIQALCNGLTADKVRVPGVEKPMPGDVYKHFDTHFAGRYKHLWEVVSFAFEVNFKGPTAGVP